MKVMVVVARTARGSCGLELRVPAVCCGLITMFGAATAGGQAPVRAFGGALDLGYVASSGNTHTTTFTLGQNLTWRPKGRLVVRQKLRSIYGSAAGAVNANLLDVDLSGDYMVFNGFGVTISGSFDRNRFAGIARRFEQSLGFSWRFASEAHDSIRFTGGALWTQQRNTSDVKREFVAFRASFAYRHPLGSGAHFQQSMEAIPNIEHREDWRFNSESALVAPITKKLGLKVSYALRYANVPVPTFKSTDQIVTAGCQMQF